MSITVRELLRLPHLQLTLTAGEAGLDREISWVHTSDLPEPWEWLGSGELLLTNGTGLSPDASVQVAYIERLAETGASGLGLGLGMSGPPLAGQAARRADELRLPLMAVPYSMPFTAVVRAVADANDREESRQLGRVARLYELLRASVLEGRTGPELFRKLGQELSVLAVLRAPAGGTAAAELGRRLARARVPHLLLHTGGMLSVLLPEDAVEAHLLAGAGGTAQPAPPGPAQGLARHSRLARRGLVSRTVLAWRGLVSRTVLARRRLAPRRLAPPGRLGAAAGSPTPYGCRTPPMRHGGRWEPRRRSGARSCGTATRPRCCSRAARPRPGYWSAAFSARCCGTTPSTAPATCRHSGRCCSMTARGSSPRPSCTYTSRRWATGSGRLSSSAAAR